MQSNRAANSDDISITIEREFDQNLTELKRENLKDKVRYLPFPVGSLIILTGLLGAAYAIYRYARFGMIESEYPPYVARYNNNTGAFDQWIIPDLQKMNFTQADMNFTCGEKYPLTDVCKGPILFVNESISVCFNFAKRLCEKNHPIGSYTSRYGYDCSQLYPLTNPCNFMSLIGYALYTCAVSASNICDETQDIYWSSWSNPTFSTLMYILMGAALIVGIGACVNCIPSCIAKRTLNDMDENKKKNLLQLAEKLGIQIQQNPDVSSMLDSINRRLEAMSSYQRAFVDGFFNPDYDQYRLFHGYYVKKNGKQIIGDGDFAMTKKILALAGYPVVDSQMLKKDFRFFRPVDIELAARPYPGPRLLVVREIQEAIEENDADETQTLLAPQ